MSYQIKSYQGTLKWVMDALARSAGKKFLMAFTGLFLINFLLVHLYGNMLLLKADGGLAFNEYSKSMLANTIIRIMEIFLFLGLILHIIFGFHLTIQNLRSRGSKGYAMMKSSVTATFFSRHMKESAVFILIFLAIHLKTFFFEHRILESGETMYESAVNAFQNIYYTGYYVVVMVILSFHLLHGFQSAFQSLGLNHNKYTPLIKILGTLYALIVPGLFAYIPVYIYIGKLQGL